jgi:hypothetical protein
MQRGADANIDPVAWIAASDTTQAQVVTGVYPPCTPHFTDERHGG